MSYKDSLLLPETNFPMRANLTQKEESFVKLWKELKIAEKNFGKKSFILHDGPPYANGSLHMGHALNKILKDIINRFKRQVGYFVPFIPGWDCHGLPIEWMVEEQVQTKDNIAIFRQQCRDFANSWVDIQLAQCMRLGVVGRFDNPYLTMNPKTESIIAREIFRFIEKGLIFSGIKPALWSPIERTVLAEAEVEYQECVTNTIFVAFPLEFDDVCALIWTTTPWTLPCNQGIAYNPNVDYGIFSMEDGRKFLLAVNRADFVFQQIRKSGFFIKTISLKELRAKHPFYDRTVSFIEADFVKEREGTGLVHIAPDHGEDDFYLGKRYGLDPLNYIDDSGRFVDQVPLVGNLYVVDSSGKEGNANEHIIFLLKEYNCFIGSYKIRHNYPISWRSKSLLIYRVTQQWFICLDQIKAHALKKIEDIVFYPNRSRHRFQKMLQQRNDWCISRQRLWGVPIPIFVDRQTNKIIYNSHIIERVLKFFSKEGSDSWFLRSPKDFFSEYNPDIHRQVLDIIDVWFESGCSHAFVLEEEHDLDCPADLYVEGSDQHRGWFQSSLLESVATRNKAPYRSILTHGFVLDGKGRKMSKSIGNIITPDSIINKYGADILRLWCASSSYSDDMRISDNILQGQVDVYRRIRNTIRWLLGNIKKDLLQKKSFELASLEKWMLYRLTTNDQEIKKAYECYDFVHVVRCIHDFCAFDCSAFYFDIRKDCLYCDSQNEPKRLSCIWLLHYILKSLLAWCSPILCFTAEEAFQYYNRDDSQKSIHLQDWPILPQDSCDESILQGFQMIIPIRNHVLLALEDMRKEKIIGASLEARIRVFVPETTYQVIQDIFEADLFIVSDAELFIGDKNIEVLPIHGNKCERCWKISKNAPLCLRCDRVVHE